MCHVPTLVVFAAVPATAPTQTVWVSILLAGMHRKSNLSCYPLTKTGESRRHQTALGRSNYRKNRIRKAKLTDRCEPIKHQASRFQEQPHHGSPKEEHEEDRGEEEQQAGQGVQVPLLQPRQGRRVHHGSEGRNGKAAVSHVRHQLRNGYQLLNRTNRRLHRLDRRVRSSERGRGRSGGEERRPGLHRRTGDSGRLRRTGVRKRLPRRLKAVSAECRASRFARRECASKEARGIPPSQLKC